MAACRAGGAVRCRWETHLPNLTDQIKGIRQKLSDPLAAAAVRLWVGAAATNRAQRLAREIMPYFKQFGGVDGNSLVPLRDAGTTRPDTAENVLARTSQRSGILLTIAELSSSSDFQAMVSDRQSYTDPQERKTGAGDHQGGIGGSGPQPLPQRRA